MSFQSNTLDVVSGPRQANLLLIAYASSEGSGEPAHQSRQNLRCSLIQAVSQEEPSDRKPDPWPLNGWACAVKICHGGIIRLAGPIYQIQRLQANLKNK